MTVLLGDPTQPDLSAQFKHIQTDFNLMVAFTLGISLSVAVGALFFFHTYMLLNNLSTIELEALHRNNIYKRPTMKENWH